MAETLANHTSGGGFSSTACYSSFRVRVWSGESLAGGVVVETSCWVLKEQPWASGSGAVVLVSGAWLLFLAGAIFCQTASGSRCCGVGVWVVGVGGGWRVV